MSNLENLVPPLELCKLIPEGEFEESAFIWVNAMNNTPKVICRPWDKKSTAAPAPTLQEIMEALPASNIYRIKQTWTANFINDSVDNGIKSKSAATAALKIYLKQSDPSDQSIEKE